MFIFVTSFHENCILTACNYQQAKDKYQQAEGMNWYN